MDLRCFTGLSAVGAGVAIAAAAAVELSRCASTATAKIKFPEEYDETPRPCTVYVFTRSLEGHPEERRIERQHWAIVVEFEDGSWRTAEGNQEDDHNIQPNYTKQSPREVGEYRELGRLQSLSPFQLRTYAAEVSLNGRPYLLGTNNCQEWAKEMASKLGSHIRESIDNINTILETSPIQGYAIAGAQASFNSFSRLFNSSSLLPIASSSNCNLPPSTHRERN